MKYKWRHRLIGWILCLVMICSDSPALWAANEETGKTETQLESVDTESNPVLYLEGKLQKNRESVHFLLTTVHSYRYRMYDMTNLNGQTARERLTARIWELVSSISVEMIRMWTVRENGDMFIAWSL